jgi:L-aspartate oxidase
MDEHVGLRRTPEGLAQALGELPTLKAEVDVHAGREAPRAVHELRSACTVAGLIVEAAAANDISVGCHYVTGTAEDASSMAR